MRLFTALLAAMPLAVEAQDNCAPHEAIVARLAERYGETRQIVGLAANGALVEIFAGEGGTWTIVVSQPGGPSCLVAAGQNYQHVAEKLPDVEG